MIKTGLVSITFRELPIEEIVTLVSKTGIDAIEWGGDIHVPHGDIKKARKVRKLCEDSNIALPSYGSYYRAGDSEENGLTFKSVLETAEALQAKTIRVWGGRQASAETSCEDRKKRVEDLVRIANIAEKSNISISLEYHANTLTDSDASTRRLIREVNHKNLHFYWQPPNGASEDESMKTLITVLPYLSNIHIFHWTLSPSKSIEMHPLEEGAKRWKRYFEVIKEYDPLADRYAMLEFVKNGITAQFKKDAKIMKELCGAFK